MKCNICGNKTSILFSKDILGKYPVNYHQCSECFFIQTDEPFWIKEAYENDAISALDTGIADRNLDNVNFISNILNKTIKGKNIFLDYGGAEGLFVRLMRDKGFNFYRYDKYAKNIYARFFDYSDIDDKNSKFDVITCFEVFEHIHNPLDELKHLLNKTNVLIFSTVLQPNKDLENWWYLIPETGQHISFYHQKTFEYICSNNDLYFYSNYYDTHIISKNKLDLKPLSYYKKKSCIKKRTLKDRFTYIQDDYKTVMLKLQSR